MGPNTLDSDGFDVFVQGCPRFLRGLSMEMIMNCNLCGGEEWLDMNDRVGVRCKKCGSLERTRLLWLYLSRLDLNPNSRVLHVAPERGIYDKLSALLGENYIAADYDVSGYSFAKNIVKIDFTNLNDWEGEQFDVIIHSHVMEHIPCNIAYPLFHIHRMLKSNGRHVCIIPFMNGGYDECFEDIGDAARIQRFGQRDHVRKFGRNDIMSHVGAILRLPEVFDATLDFEENDLRQFNIPKTFWRGYTTATVLVLEKGDYMLA